MLAARLGPELIVNYKVEKLSSISYLPARRSGDCFGVIKPLIRTPCETNMNLPEMEKRKS